MWLAKIEQENSAFHPAVMIYEKLMTLYPASQDYAAALYQVAMLKQENGVIVNLASLAGLGGAPGLGAYVASKHGVVGLTRTAALEYSKRGIRVNAVCPSFTNTDMVRRMIDKDPKLEQILNNASPMKRMGEPREVASAVAYLCSDEASFTNGQALALDGGITAW